MTKTLGDAFEAQLTHPDTVTSDGDYLHGRTRDEVIQQFGNYRLDKPSDVSTSKTAPTNWDAVLDAKIAEWENHIGEKLLYYYSVSGTTLHVRQCWDSKLDQMTEEWEIDTDHEQSSVVPYLRKK